MASSRKLSPHKLSYHQFSAGPVGTPTWYGRRWRTRWHSLRNAIRVSKEHFEAAVTGFHPHGSAPEEYTSTGAAHNGSAPNESTPRHDLATLHKAILDLLDDGNSARKGPSRMGSSGMGPSKMALSLTALPNALLAFHKDRKTRQAVSLLGDLLTFGEAVLQFFCTVAPERVDLELVNPRHSAEVAELLQALEAVAAQYKDFSAGHYPLNFLLRVLSEQISVDLTIIRQAINQRHHVAHKLIVADHTAGMALSPAIKAGFLARTPADTMTYLNERVEVRLLPYHNTILIGVPFAADIRLDTLDVPNLRSADVIGDLLDDLPGDSTGEPGRDTMADSLWVSSDYLTLPHEVAHLLFQHGRVPETGEPIRACLEQTLIPADWRLAWLEELFADVYGCLVAGPISVLGFQEILADGLPADDSGELDDYPFPALRPLIQSQILRRIAQQLPTATEPYAFIAAADLLDAHWHTLVPTIWPAWDAVYAAGKFDDQMGPLRSKLYSIHNTAVSGAQIIDALTPVIDSILALLHPLLPTAGMKSTWTPDWTPDWTLTTWQHGAHHAAAPQTPRWHRTVQPTLNPVTDLYDSFIAFAQAQSHHALQPILADIEQAVEQAEGHATLERPFSPGGNFTRFLSQLAQLRAHTPNPTLDDVAKLILFRGWSNEGPSNVGHGDG